MTPRPSRFARPIPRRLVPALALGVALVPALAAARDLAAPALPDDGNKIAQPYAVFSGLDKITGRIISFDVAIDETVQFGALQVTPRACYSRPQTVAPLTDSFVEVDEITLDNKIRRIFSGWMFADSPGLHAVDHAVYDVWLTDCRGAAEEAAKKAAAGQGAPAASGAATGKTDAPKTDAAATPAAPKPAAPKSPAAPKPAAAAPSLDPANPSAAVDPTAAPPKPQRPKKPAPAVDPATGAPIQAGSGAGTAPRSQPPSSVIFQSED
jgi:hypothetical protein